MATARTMHEYLNTPGGAVYGFSLRAPEHLPKAPPQTFATSVKGLFLASAYSGSGGFTRAMGAGDGPALANN
jgi:all-trans-retinol 13,14-reductase